MMEYIKGVLAEATPDRAIVEVNHIGYKFFTPVNLYAKLPAVGSSLCLFISTVIREDSEKSYAFLTKSERDFFESLIDISGIGPKLALALLGHIEMDDLYFALQRADISLLSKIPGIGKKTAERLIIELRGKIPEKMASLPKETGKAPLYNDAYSALVNLGYSSPHVHKALQEVFAGSGEEFSLSDLITKSLHKINR